VVGKQCVVGCGSGAQSSGEVLVALACSFQGTGGAASLPSVVVIIIVVGICICDVIVAFILVIV